MTIRIAAIAASVILTGLAVFQLLLALGLPLARFSWGGQFDGALPPAMRLASLVAIAILALAGWLVLGAAGMVGPARRRRGVSIAVLAFAAYFALNTVGNLMSASLAEKLTMTPVSAALSLLFATVGIAGLGRVPARERP